MPDYCLDLCDGHHETVDFLVDKSDSVSFWIAHGESGGDRKIRLKGRNRVRQEIWSLLASRAPDNSRLSSCKNSRLSSCSWLPGQCNL
jgi:hypothetical protein